MVAAGRRGRGDGAAGDGVFPVHRCAARCAGSETQMTTTPNNDVLLRVRDLRISFRVDKKNTVQAIKGISFDVPQDATVALVGESGSGKSVSSLAVMGLLPPETTIVEPGSSVLFNGNELLNLPLAERRK